MNKNIPKHWKWVKLKEICEVITGTTPPKSDMSNYGDHFPFFKPPHLWDGLISETDEMISLKGSLKARIVPPNTVLVTCIGNLGRTGFVKKEAAFNQQINAILENEEIDGKYIFYHAQSPTFKNQLEKLATGTTVSIVNKGNFETIEIPLPPLPEQLAIVSKIEELLSDLDNGKQQLLTAQQQLKVYRQSLLKWAFEGKLQTSVGELFDFVGGGTPSKSVPEYWQGDIPWASVKDVKGDYLNNTQDRISIDGLNNSASNIAKANEVILITRISPGKAIITNIDTAINQDLKIVKPKFKTTPKYIYYIFKSIEWDCVKKSNGTTVLGINLTNLKEISIPKLNFEEQQLIVDELESKLTICDKIEETLSQSLLQAETLRQSILKKAFEGKLV
jgi:type I restriction enzyme, S subunit